ncbi:hypothetical protein LL037_16535 [Clostridium estertheticum]|uniref:PD(D/E)XK endonuclease domain-containing protein n=1 Tax=Clostridium estertheticum TaxID=238834 RepID=A0AA47ELW9_9CLOT|nr:hypothetical protein [Clostridium estertheticum]MBU3157546.1 hypothetical protein [Clostridium estertheticum]MBU3200823.1 hypothetical protein [Clostridium estertheticum]WAG61804.1 hypothetical protein LL038_06045 [Clostridium estertheticum]WAG64075.1 hypothetical protein LL037_16535 [Clostridium estertheticum]
MRYRHSAGFGKRIEYYIIGLMLKEGLDCYMPLVDADGIDVVIKKSDGSFIEVQIKARSNDVKFGDAGLFAGMNHELRNNYFFVFYSERMETMWIMSSEEYLSECNTNKNGKNVGKRSIWINGKKKNTETNESEEYTKPRFEKYIATDFSKLDEIL